MLPNVLFIDPSHTFDDHLHGEVDVSEKKMQPRAHGQPGVEGSGHHGVAGHAPPTVSLKAVESKITKGR